MRFKFNDAVAVLGAVICVLGCISSVGIFFFIDWQDGNSVRESMLVELFNFSITTVFVGGAVLFYQAAARAKETRSNSKKRLEEFYREFTETYNDIKYYRRELRREFTAHTEDEYVISRESYEKLLRELNRGQLRLEAFRRILQSRPEYLSFLEGQGLKSVYVAEEYLRQITKEYESKTLSPLENDDGLLLVPSDSRLFQYVVSRSNAHHDGSSLAQHFGPLDDLFNELALNIESQD